MPQEGAAILSQIEGLMEQFLALDYDTPVKDEIQQMLSGVRSGMQELRSQGDTDVPDQSQETGPQDLMAQGPRDRDYENLPSDFRGARDRAMADQREGRGPIRTRTDSDEEEEQSGRKRRRARAPY